MSSRTDLTKRSTEGLRKSGEATKRSVDCTRRSNSPYGTSRSLAQDMERIMVMEQQIKSEKEKYRKLEKKYKELMASQSQNQSRFEHLVQDLQRRLEEKHSGKVTMSSIMQDLSSMRNHLEIVEQRLDSTIELINPNN